MSSARFPLTLVSLGLALASSPALAQHERHHADAQTSQATRSTLPTGQPDADTKRVGDPYPLATCPVSGEALGEMGDAVVRVYDGREVRFCCEDCVPRFETDMEAYTAKIDAEIVEAQLPFYAMTTCIVSGDPLVEGGEDVAVNQVFNNRLVRLCCKMCKKEFASNPEKFLEKIDLAIAEAQRETYPLQTCLVSGEELGSMGEPHEVVIANHLVRLCCEMCMGKLEKDPAGFLADLDRAWKAAGMDLKLPETSHEEHGHDGHNHGG